MIFFNFKIDPDKFVKGKLLDSLQTQNLYDRYLNYKSIKNKNSKFNQIKNIILSYLKKEPDQVTFLLLFNEYYLFYENLYNNLEKNKLDDDYILNVFYTHNSKYMLINIIKSRYLQKYEPRINGESDYSDVIIITSDDIYQDIKKELKKKRMNICQMICISFQDDAINFYYDFQDYIVKECILEKKIEKYYIPTNYGLKLPYQFIKEKFIDSLNSTRKNHDIKEFNVNDYKAYREKKMSSDLIRFIDTVICHPVNYKEFDQNKKLYCISIKFEKNNYISDKFNNYRFIGPLCSSKIEAECEANLLLFKVLYHFGEIKLPILEGRSLTYQGTPLSSENNYSSMSKSLLISDENSTKSKSTSFLCPEVFSKDSWISNDQEPYPNNFYNPKNLFFVSYLEYNKNGLSDIQRDLFCYNNIVKIDKIGTDYKRIINKVELCLGYITKKPLPINVPVIDIQEYKNENIKFNLKSWNKYDVNFCDNNNNKKNNKDEDETPNDIIIDNSDCQSYLPVYFSDEELRIIETFQGYSWKMLFGNNNLQSFESNNISDEKLNDMYYVIPISKINDVVEINWEIMESINSTMGNLQSKNNITLGDWIYYANNFIKNPNESIYNNDGTYPINFINNTFEENCYFLKEFHKNLNDDDAMENEINEEIKNMDNDTQKIIEKSLKKVYMINKFDKTVCFFTGLNREVRKEKKFILNRKLETKEITYQEFFEDKYKASMKNKYEYKYKDSPLFSYDAHSLIHSLQRDDNDETGEKKNMYIPEFYCVFAVPHAWIKLLPLIPIFTYKIKILSFMNEFRYNIGFKKLTLETIYRASMSKSADPIIGERHERLELLGDSILKYLSSINILNSYFNRNEDLLIHRRNDFIKNEFLIEQINNLGWKKYSIKQRYSLKNFCPPNFDVNQVSNDLDKKIISEDKNDKSVADFYEALIGACFEDGIKSYKNGMFSIENLYNESFSLNKKDKARAIEEGIKLCKMFLIRTKNIITDHWRWEPVLINKNIIKANKKNMKHVSEKLGHKFIENSSLFSVVNYTKETYSKYSISDCKRLKFIGESVLDLITVIFYYSTKVDATPKDLTEYKHMAVSKNSYAKLFAELDILDKFNVDQKIRSEYKKAKQSIKSKQSSNNENYPKYLSEIFEVLIGSILIDNKYHFGKTNLELVNLLNDKLYKTLDKRKKMFNVINNCIELIQSILKEHRHRQDNQNIVRNQQVSFELKNGKMCMIVKDFTGKTIVFEEFSEPESSNAKRYIATKIMNIKNDLGDEFFKFAVLKRLSVDPNDKVSEKFWTKESLSTFDINKSLIIACKYNYESVIKTLIEKGSNVNGEDNYKNTPLIEACLNENEKIVKYLIEKGAHINKTNKDGDTALIVSTKIGHENLIQYLIKNGANINVTNKKYETPLIIACEYEYENIVKILIEKGADINIKNIDNNTPLTISCLNGNENIVQYLIEHIIKINKKNKNGNIPSIVEEVNKKLKDGDTLLIKACKDEKEKIIELLVENGADVNMKNKDNEIPIVVAIRNRNNNIINYLMDHGADMDFIGKKNDKNNKNKLLIEACHCNDEYEIKRLIENGADVNTQDKNGDTPLIITCKNEQENIIKILVENGADVNKPGRDGRIPIIIAFKSRNKRIINYLMDHGADI